MRAEPRATTPYKIQIAGPAQTANPGCPQPPAVTRICTFALLHEGWNGKYSKVPSGQTLADAVTLAVEIGDLVADPGDIVPANTGQIVFELAGITSREVELWVGERPGYFTFLATENGRDFDGVLAIRQFRRIERWLKGESIDLH